MPEPVLSDAQRHLELLFGDAPAESLIEIAWTDDAGRLNRAKLFGSAEIGAAARHAVEMNKAGANVYVGVNPRKPGTKNARANGNDIELSCFNFVDIDNREAVMALAERADKLPYTFVVITGSKPSWRVHAYWRLEEGCRNLEKPGSNNSAPWRPISAATA